MNYEQELLIKIYNCIGHLFDENKFSIFNCQECGLKDDMNEILELVSYVKSLNFSEDKKGYVKINK